MDYCILDICVEICEYCGYVIPERLEPSAHHLCAGRLEEWLIIPGPWECPECYCDTRFEDVHSCNVDEGFVEPRYASMWQLMKDEVIDADEAEDIVRAQFFWDGEWEWVWL